MPHLSHLFLRVIAGVIRRFGITNHLLHVTAQFRLGRIRIVVSIPACHAGGRGSIPRFGGNFCHLLGHSDIVRVVLILGQ